jgi:hypothetical protein
MACRTVALLAIVGSLSSLAESPRYSASTNFAADLTGTPDSRPGTWGNAGVITFKIHFSIPPGDRVRILRVYGDFLVWPKGKATEGTYAGALFGLLSDSPDGIPFPMGDFLAQNCFLYVQTATGGKPERAPFDTVVATGGLLGTDNTLYVKIAVWLNDTGLPIHMEPTWVSVFQVEDASGNPVDLSHLVITANGKAVKRAR